MEKKILTQSFVLGRYELDLEVNIIIKNVIQLLVIWLFIQNKAQHWIEQFAIWPKQTWLRIINHKTANHLIWRGPLSLAGFAGLILQRAEILKVKVNNLSQLGFWVGIDVGNRAISLLDYESSRANFHTPVPCWQTSANSALVQPGRKWKTKFWRQ